MVNRRNPAAADPYPLFDAVGRSVIITAAAGAPGSTAARAPDRLHHGGQPATACGGAEAVGPAGNLASRASAEMLGLLRRWVTGFGPTAVTVTHHPVAAAYSPRDSRWPAGCAGRHAAAAGPSPPPAPLPAHVGYRSIT